MFTLRSIRTALLVGMLSLTTLTAANAGGYSRDFRAHNYHDASVVALLIKPVDDADWTATTGDRIAPGYWERIDVSGFAGRCEFNLYAKFSDGSSSYGTFDLCAVTDVNV